MKLISRIDELILIAVWKLGTNAYGMAIREEIMRATGMNWLLGAIYGPLARLYRQGLVTSVKGEPTPERGGRAKVYYELTPAGRIALQKIRDVSAEMWKGAGKIEA